MDNLNSSFMDRIKTAIKENIASHEIPDDFFGATALGFKRFEVLYMARFTPKCYDCEDVLIVAVKHKMTRVGNVTVFEVRVGKDGIFDGRTIAAFDGHAHINFEKQEVYDHNVCYSSFTREHADAFFRMMFDSMNHIDSFGGE